MRTGVPLKVVANDDGTGYHLEEIEDGIVVLPSIDLPVGVKAGDVIEVDSNGTVIGVDITQANSDPATAK